ncbi:MAG: T9SS type A sorting domain-containing protein [Bacteroidales bacterium]|nr:T9SS type A sorting domain-containing protein [Bacteroidales bacterium]
MKATFRTAFCCIVMMMLAWTNLTAQATRLNFSDTVSIQKCENEFPIFYDDTVFREPGNFILAKYDTLSEDTLYTLYIVQSLPNSDTLVDLGVCPDGLPIFYSDYLLTDTGVYQLPFVNHYGCDSLVKVDVHFLPTYDLHDTMLVTVCSYDLPYVLDEDHQFNAPGAYDVPYPTQAGCDSLNVFLKLSVVQSNVDSLNVKVCQGNYPLVMDTTVLTSGLVNWTVVDSLPETIDSSLFYFDAPGTYTYFFDGASSCPDVYTLNITTIEYEDTIRIDVCESDVPYDFQGITLTVDTTFKIPVVDCDTFSQVIFSVHPKYADEAYDTITICQNQMPYDDPVTHLTYLTPGVVEYYTPSMYGCDSLTTHRTVIVVDNPVDTLTILVGESWYPTLYGDSMIAEEGEYDVAVPDTVAFGCDTLRHLYVVTVPSVYDTVEAVTCSNEPYIYLDSALTEEGSYDFILQNAAGGDSVVTVILSLLPSYVMDTLFFNAHEIYLPFVYDTLEMYETGDYTMHYQTAEGCDSLQPVHLYVIPAVYNPDTIIQEICSSQLPYEFADSLLTEGGLYAFITDATEPGYDSVYYYRLIVHENPAPTIAGEQYLCAGGSENLTAEPADLSYLWNTGETSQIISVAESGTYVVTVTDEFDCQGSEEFTVTVVELPNIQLAGNQEICAGNSAVLTVSGGSSYIWENGSTTDTVEVYPSATTTYHVTATNDYNCSREGYLTVVVNELPVVYINGQDTICEGATTTFAASGTGVDYAWSNGSSATFITVNTQGLYTLTVTDANGCSSTASRHLVVFNNPTVQIIGRTSFCVGSTTMVTATGAASYEWSSGELTQSISTLYAGTYTVTGTDAHGCSSTAQVTLVSSQVTASISGNRFFCENGSTTLTVTGNEAYTYQWYDGSTTESVTINAPGLYTVTVTNSLGCSSTIQANVTQYALPTPTITGSVSICQGSTTTLRANGGVSYQWDDGSTQAILTVSTAGTYVVTATANNGCSAAVSATVVVNPTPTLTLLSNEQLCQGQSVSIYAISSTGNSYNWSTGQNTSFITVSPTSNTMYTVLVTDANGCTNTASTTITVSPSPSVFVTGPSSVCQGTPAQLTAVGGTTYLWNNGSTSSTIQATTSGTYQVTATDANGCSGNASFTLQVSPIPSANIAGDLHICQGGSTTLSAPSGFTYRWDDNSTSQTRTVNTSGTYTVTVTNDAGCYATGSATVAVHQKPTLNFGVQHTICQGESYTYSLPQSENINYVWSNGSTGHELTVNTAGTYSVTATNQYGCSTTGTDQLTVLATPNAAINGNLTICQGQSTTLRATGGVSYLWDDASTQSYINVTSSGTYSVTVTGNNGCSATTSATVIVNPSPSLSLLANETLCAGDAVTIYAISAPGNTYNWSSGQTTSVITVSPTVNTMYTVLVSDPNGCTATASTTITVAQQPNILISGTHTACYGDTVTLTAVGATSYLWSNGATTAVNRVTSTGNYSVTATDANGCHNTSSFDVTVSPIPTANITGNLSICQGGSTTLTAPAGYTYHWSDNSTERTLTVNTSGVYSVTVSNGSGCSATGSATVAVHAKPTLNFGVQHTICEGQSYTYSLPNDANLTYVWSNGATGHELTVSSAGTYSVTVTNEFGCSTSATDQMTVLTAPTASIDGNLTICQGQTTNLRASGGVTYLWDDASTQSYHNVTTSGTYTVTVTANNGCTASASATVIVNPTPSLSILSNEVLCVGDAVTLYAISASGNTYNWSTGQTTSIITVSPTVNTMYTVLVTDPNGCTATASTNISVVQLPVIHVNGANVACQGDTVVLTATGATSYVWSNGANSNVNPVTTSGTYSVTATDANGCHGIASASVQISPIPTASITGNLNICQGQSTTLSAPSGYAYQWSNNSTAQSIQVNAPGVYKVTVSNAAGCSSSDSVEVVVHELPTLTFGMQHDICAGQSYTYTLPQLANITYTWSNGSSGSQITVDSAGVYTVTATNEFGCSTSASDQLVVHPLPTPTINGNVSICRGEAAILSAHGGTSYVWSNGATTEDIAMYPTTTSTYAVTATSVYGCSAATAVTVTVKVLPSINFVGNTSICEGNSTTISVTGGNNYTWSTGSTNNSITVSTPGTYFVTATNSLGCSRADSVHVTQLPLPVVTLQGENNICAGQAAMLTATGAAQYVWSTQDVGSVISVMPQTTTIYTVTATNAQGCSTTASRTVTVNALPDVQIAGVLTICQGETTNLSASGAFSYMWSTGSNSANITVSEGGNYTVVGTAVNGCQASQTVTLTVNPVPVMSIQGSPTLCTNESQTLVATGATAYLWNDGTTTDNLTVNTGGIYTVTGTNAYGCSSSTSLNVASIAVPYISIVGQSDYCEGSFTTLYASTDATQYLWNTGETTQSIVVNAATSDLYSLTVTGDNGCHNTAELQVNVHETYQVNITDEVCQGTAYTNNGFNLPEQTVAGNFVHTLHLQSQFGCDSVITLMLLVKPLPSAVGEISGNPYISTYGSYMYSITANDVTRYEWRITHPQWVLTDNNVSSAFVQINTNGTGTLTARLINNCGFIEKSIVITCGVSVEEYVNDSQILIYPNPVQDVLTIHTAEAASSVAYVTLVDNLGRTLQTIASDGSDVNISCASYAAGIYYVRCLDSNHNTVDVRKIIVKK